MTAFDAANTFAACLPTRRRKRVDVNHAYGEWDERLEVPRPTWNRPVNVTFGRVSRIASGRRDRIPEAARPDDRHVRPVPGLQGGSASGPERSVQLSTVNRGIDTTWDQHQSGDASEPRIYQ
jgi:hypothetical protein